MPWLNGRLRRSLPLGPLKQNERELAGYAPAIFTMFKPRHPPGLFRFRLYHAHRPELGVLLGPIYLGSP